MRFALPLFVVSLLAVACQKPPHDDPIYTVNVWHLSRDLYAAAPYAGKRVRLHLAATEYDLAENELRIYGTIPNTPPLVICRCPAGVPESNRDIVVTGRARFVRDGIRRATHCDHCCYLDDCSISTR